MRKVPLVLGLVLVMTGSALAAQSLTNQQMDVVTAGSVASPELMALVASVTPGPPPPLVSKDNYPPSMFTQPTGQNPFQPYVGVPSSQYSGCNVYCGGLAQPAR